MTYGVQDMKDRAIALMHEMLQESRETENIPSIGIALMYCAELFKLYNDKDKVRVYAQELCDICDKYNLPIYKGYGQMQLDWSNESIVHEQETYDVLYNEGSFFSFAHYQSFYAETYASQGQLEKAIVKLNRCIEIDQGIPHLYYMANLKYTKAKCLLQLGPEKQQEASSLLEEALELAKSQGAIYYVRLIENEILNNKR